MEVANPEARGGGIGAHSERAEHLAPLTRQHLRLGRSLLPCLNNFGDGANLPMQRGKLLGEPRGLASGLVFGPRLLV
jgi:hypothetical protein